LFISAILWVLIVLMLKFSCCAMSLTRRPLHSRHKTSFSCRVRSAFQAGLAGKVGEVTAELLGNSLDMPFENLVQTTGNDHVSRLGRARITEQNWVIP
jgi:hypothetical protein